MMIKILPLLVLLSFTIMPSTDAEEAKTTEGTKIDAPETNEKVAENAHEKAQEKPAHAVHATNGCLVSESAIADMETREERVQEAEAAVAKKETELKALQIAIQEQLSQLDEAKKQIQGIKHQEIAKNEEKVKKLIDTFETMSPKAAAQVVAKVDEEIAVTTLARLSTIKAGKILAAMDPSKSARLSERMVLGDVVKKGAEK